MVGGLCPSIKTPLPSL
ncbi:hypothetical protein MTR67_017561 [Solanum verrucosum]|uniref:Uncharacterized protein n=1 Tax=Solanum verrucosum TaxID=315347 RepID=A0AAF0QP30_SOLVR|nr:hypothetical protein MTR67_017561 [Solanum verrucosum]